MKTLLLVSFIFAVLYTVAILILFFISESRKPKHRPMEFPEITYPHRKW